MDSVMSMQSDLDAERRATERQWAKREANINRLLGGTAGMYGDLQGIIGKTLPELESMSIGELT